MVAEYNSAGTLTRRYVHGDQVDEPWVQYSSAATGSANWRYLHADHQGSIIAHSTVNGAQLTALSYDAYGIPKSTNSDRFGYTGQAWLKELGLFHYKARMYSPKLGRFLQTDPIFYADQMNMYAYVGNDPVNKIDPTGKFAVLLLFAPEIILAIKATLFVGSAVTVAAVASDAIDTESEGEEASWDNVVFGDKNAAGPYSPLPPENNNNDDDENKNDKKQSDKDKEGNSKKEKYNQGAEHTKGSRGSTAEKHEKAETRRAKDQGGEKGDKRREYRR